MKRSLAFFLTALLVLSLVGCGMKQKIEEKAAEQFLEGLGGGDVDLDGDTLTIKGEDRQEVTFGSTEWPSSELSKAIPVFAAGTIDGVVDSEEYLMVTIQEVARADFESYVEAVKKDFTEDAYSVESNGILSYGGSNGTASVTLSYTEEDQTAIISMSLVQK